MTAARERAEGIPGGWRCPTLQQYPIPALHTSTSKKRNTVPTTFPLSFLFFLFISRHMSVSLWFVFSGGSPRRRCRSF